MCVRLCLCIMAKQIKAMTSTLYLANEFIEVLCFKTILVINENILVSKITMALVVNNIYHLIYRLKLCKILFLDSFEYLICMDLAFMYETQKVNSYNNKIISAYLFLFTASISHFIMVPTHFYGTHLASDVIVSNCYFRFEYFYGERF